MQNQLNQKETTLLQDLQNQEQICVEKYRKYAQQTHAPALKNLFNQIEQDEQTHMQTISQILSGSVPPTSGGSQVKDNVSPHQSADYSSDDMAFKNDKYLCTDALSTEKYVSSAYNTSVFEMRNTAIRDALNHIQKEEQQHGELIYGYMSQNGMYS